MFSRKLEQNEESRKIPKDDLESGVKFITDEIKPDIDAMAVQIFTDLPEENPFQLSDTAPEQVLIHQQTVPVYQQLTIEDPHSGVTQALEGNWVVPEIIYTPSTEGLLVQTPPPQPIWKFQFCFVLSFNPLPPKANNSFSQISKYRLPTTDFEKN